MPFDAEGALASAFQWVSLKSCLFLPINTPKDFVVSKVTLTMITNLGCKILPMFGTTNILAMGAFSAL